MIAFIRGTVAAYGADWIIVDNHGMGWRVAYPHTDHIRLNQDIQVFTYMHITENDMALYGFESLQEQDLFERLISVKGLGPKTAMSILGRTTMNRLIESIENGDVSVLKSMPGIGAKTASQIILDLKGKLVTHESDDSKLSDELKDAAEGLKSLGYKQAEVAQAIREMAKQPGLTSEAYLKLALQFLMKKVR